jgi:ketosteroid isomerase-like protein
MPYGGEHVGREGFVRVAKAMNETWEIPDGLEMSFHELEDDRVIQFVSWTGVSRHTGRSVPVRMVTVYTFRDGRIGEIDIYYWDTAEIVEATGGVKTL